MAAANLELLTPGLEFLTPDLAFLLSDKGVPLLAQGLLAECGFTTVRLFALMGDDRKEFRAVLKGAPFLLDPAGEEAVPGARIKVVAAVARLTDAWEAAVSRVAERNKVDAEMRASGVPLTLPGGDHVEMRRAWEVTFGRVHDRDFPADALVERRLQEIEQNDLRAESLIEVASRDEMREDTSEAVWFQGALRVKRPLTKVPLPPDSEALRRRLKLLGATYIMAKMKHPGNPWLRTSTPEVWQGHLEHILGERVFGLRIAGAGSDILPEWATILSYEHELRKEAVRLVQYEGLDIAAALLAARKDVEIRERCFTAPCLAGMVRASLPQSRAASSDDRYRREKSRPVKPPFHKEGKGAKGKGKGKDTKNSKGGVHRVTADNKPICFRYNDGVTCDAPCGRVHCCQICLGPHSKVDHGKSPS
jgi:hypothetical protein